MMVKLLLVLILGFLAGRAFGGRIEKVGRVVATCGLFVLLFAMGTRLGQDQGIRTQFASFGVSALGLAVAASAGAVVFSALLERVVKRRKSR